MPFIMGGRLGGGRYSGGIWGAERVAFEFEVKGLCEVDVSDEDRDFVIAFWGAPIVAVTEDVGLAVAEDVCEFGDAKMGFVDASFRGSPLGVISRSGNVMKKRQPKVVPKKAPSTDWKRLFGGV